MKVFGFEVREAGRINPEEDISSACHEYPGGVIGFEEDLSLPEEEMCEMIYDALFRLGVLEEYSVHPEWIVVEGD